MRIVLYNVTTGFKSGGIETDNWEKGQALWKLGHDVILVTGAGDRCKFNDLPLIRVPFRDRSDCIDFRWLNTKIGSTLRKYLERRSFAANAIETVMRLEPDCIVIFKPYDFGFMAKLKRANPNLTVVFRSGGKDFFYTDRLTKRFVDVWISCSEYNRRQIEARYGRDVTVIPHGVNTEVFRPAPSSDELRRKIGADDESLLVGGIGRLVKWKGYQMVIQALSRLEGVELMLIGAGGFRGGLEEMSRALGIDDRVHFLGEIDNYRVPQYLAQCDLYVHPSIGQEAFGITLLEAMACGIPVVASDKGAIPDVVGDGTGIIVEARNVEAWIDAIEQLRRNTTERLAMGRAGRARVLEHFSWERNAQAFLTAIEKARSARAGRLNGTA
ncbi:MAG: glycosyltransferase family 4 protein [Gammaproteobacteria bacterium]|nr:glycosyltransferase family 4 protein [Gammaproteobacteria bacterium]